MEGSNGGGREMRRANVVYFLSRNSKTEHPHLLQFHHPGRNGVRLKDVKKWLSALRGNDMPDCFAWSYKRRYKAGYVWQDLLDDDDLITPVADDEYVLKGSELLPKRDPRPSFDMSAGGSTPKHKHKHKLEPVDQANQATPSKSTAETLYIEDDQISPKPPPRIDQESPPLSNSKTSFEPGDRTSVFKIDISKPEQHEAAREKQQQQQQPQLTKQGNQQLSTSLRKSSCRTNTSGHACYNGSSSRRASSVLWNLFGCRSSETNDAALMPMISRHDSPLSVSRKVSIRDALHNRRPSDADVTDQPHNQHSSNPNNINARSVKSNGRKGWSASERRGSRKAEQKAVPVAYRPVAEPTCSQCGKKFKPEKLHFHMKSCKALRGREKKTVINKDRSSPKSEVNIREFSEEASASYLLIH